MTTPLQTYLSEIRARVEKASRAPWFVHPKSEKICYGDPSNDNRNYPLDDPDDDEFIIEARTDIPRLLRIVERAVEALENAELSFMGMGNATIDHGLPPTAQELVNMCEDRAKRMQAFLAEIDAMAKGESNGTL